MRHNSDTHSIRNGVRLKKAIWKGRKAMLLQCFTLMCMSVCSGTQVLTTTQLLGISWVTI